MPLSQAFNPTSARYPHRQERFIQKNVEKRHTLIQKNVRNSCVFVKKSVILRRKAEENVHAKSLRTFIENNPNLHALRLSMKGYIEQIWMENRPLYAPDGWLL